MGGLRLEFFGYFSAVYDGVTLTGLNTPRLQALLAYLVLHPHPLFRQHLAAQFWPESSEAQARTNLRNLVHLLRQALPHFDEFIQSDAKTLQWRAAVPVWLDVREFEQALIFSPGSPPDRERLGHAAALYRGDLLSGCYDDWIAPERERLRRAYLATLEALAELSENARDYPAALQTTHQLLQADPLHGAANHRLIRLHALGGNPSAALKAYQGYANLLKRELEIDPEPETQALYQQLKRASAPRPPLEPAPSAPVGPVPLVGRYGEWKRILFAWGSAVRGNPQALFVTGEAGIGKTRLVEELVQWASRQGVHLALASCFPAEGSLPYAPVVTWLRAQPLPRLDKVWLSELARLLPEIARLVPKVPPPAPITAAWQRQRMFEALAKAVLEEKRPTLLVIEDIHWCDQDTLEWLHYLLRYDAHAPLLLVATERSEEIAQPDHPLKKLQAALAAAGKYNAIPLKALNETESLQLAEAASQTGLRPETAAQIFRETEGNPLFIVEMVRLGSQAQSLVQPPGAPESLPEKVQAVLKRRIAQLSPPTRELASLAATLGREFHLDVLLQASGWAEVNLVAELDKLLLHQIVHEQTPNQYDFTHDKLRQAVFTGLSSAHRRLLHHQAAEAYLRLAGDFPQARAAEIARHYDAAGMFLSAIHYYRLAADVAARLFSTGDAIQNLARALELAQTAGVNSIPAFELAQILEKMGDLLALAGKFPQAQARFEQALAQPASLAPIWRSQVYRKLSEVFCSQYQFAAANLALDGAESSLRNGTLAEKQEWLQIQLARLQVCYWGNDPAQMEVLIPKISPMIKAVGRVDQQLSLLSQEVQFRTRRERFVISSETVSLSRRRLSLAETLDDPIELAVAQFQYGFMLLWHGDLAAARDWLIQGCVATERVGTRLWYLRSLAYLSVASRKLNDQAALRAQVAQLLEIAPTMNEHTYQGIGLANRGWLAWQEGAAAQAEQDCKEAIQVWANFGQDVFQGLAYWVLLAVALARRDLPQAQVYTQTLLDPNPLYRPVPEAAAALLRQAVSACRAQDSASAYELFSQALEQARAAHEL